MPPFDPSSLWYQPEELSPQRCWLAHRRDNRNRKISLLGTRTFDHSKKKLDVDREVLSPTPKALVRVAQGWRCEASYPGVKVGRRIYPTGVIADRKRFGNNAFSVKMTGNSTGRTGRSPCTSPFLHSLRHLHSAGNAQRELHRGSDSLTSLSLSAKMREIAQFRLEHDSPWPDCVRAHHSEASTGRTGVRGCKTGLVEGVQELRLKADLVNITDVRVLDDADVPEVDPGPSAAR